jgi:UDP-N-acetylmuramoyl-tripeptide--D-alanyl-D-alanine ligase
MKRTLAEFARLCGGRLAGADAAFTDVVSDSRTLAPGQLFVALSGPKFDGNDFVAAAHAAGAAGAVVSAAAPLPRRRSWCATRRRRSSRLRACARSLGGPLIGVAGSNGKTTAKEMTAAILARRPARRSPRAATSTTTSAPLTLLRLTPAHRFAVIEMGANRAGEVAALVGIARPSVGLITNAGAEHLEGFGSLEGVARAEGEMVAGLSDAATAVINADDAFAGLWRRSTLARVVTFGVRARADFSASEVQATVGEGGFRTHFRLNAPQGSAAIELPSGVRTTWPTRSPPRPRRRVPARRSSTSPPVSPPCARYRAGCSSSRPAAAPG